MLVIRGELLKRYPTAVIYAHAREVAAQGRRRASIPRKERELVDLDAAEEDNPPRAKVRTPLYEAKVDPDIYFFGFDLDRRRGAAAGPASDRRPTTRAGSS